MSTATGPHEGPAVVLRPFGETDAPAIAQACDDPATARFIPGMPAPYTDADARAFLERTAAWRREGSRFGYAIAAAETGELLGAIALHCGPRASVGYWVAPWARGRGVATAAVRLLAGWALGEGGIDRLELTTHPENLASQRVAEKAGFVREGLVEGYLQTEAGPRDSVVFARER